MPVSKNAYKRYLILNNTLRQKNYPSMQKLLNILGEEGYAVSKSTVEKDLETMRSKFGRSIEYDRAVNGYYCTREDVNFDLPLSSDDVETIRMAIGKLSIFRNTTAFKNVKKSLERIMSRLEIELSDKSSGAGDIIYYEPIPDFAGKEWISIIYDAIYDRKKISFSFHDLNNQTDHILEPYLLKEYMGRWYVAGRENKNAELYGLDRVRDLCVTGQSFMHEEEFADTMKYAIENSVGILNFKKRKHPVIIHYDASLADEIKNRIIHQSQHILAEDAREIAVWFDVNVNEEFLKHAVLPYGDKAKIAGPPFVIDKVLRIYRGALDQYKEYEEEREKHKSGQIEG